MEGRRHASSDNVRLIAGVCFFLSGIASVSYQMIWLRQAMMYFGVVTPVISALLSVFMLGLLIGTYAGGRFVRNISGAKALRLYAGVELLIGLYALCVPPLFRLAHHALLSQGAADSTLYLLSSWAAITCLLLPVCSAIGVTLPLMMRVLDAHKIGKNFGRLYVANLYGALLGCLLPLVVIELGGFAVALYVSAAMNIAAAAVASLSGSSVQRSAPPRESAPLPVAFKTKLVLFIIGFVALGSEVIWIRLLTPELKTSVYAFAAILAAYLLGNFAGGACYLKKTRATRADMLAALLLPVGLLMALWLNQHGPAALAAIFFWSVLCGFITPRLVDDVSQGNPFSGARAYSANLLGCIAGPLATTYVLFPAVGLRGTLTAYACMTLVASLLLLKQNAARFLAGALLILGIAIPSVTYEDQLARNGSLARDQVGYSGVISEAMDKKLVVNGIFMTNYNNITKYMAHLPMLARPSAQTGLVICFGMGTTLRSLASWPLADITVAELSPGVLSQFGRFFGDAEKILADPRVHVVVDDGRRYLNRSDKRYDIVTIDPPPPHYASASGLLYSAEFYDAVRARLNPGGVLATWLPRGDALLKHSFIAAIKSRFAHVAVYRGVNGTGMHVLASDAPLAMPASGDAISRMPHSARADFMEWMPPGISAQYAAAMMLNPLPLSDVFVATQAGRMLTDDRPYNEFFLLRQERSPLVSVAEQNLQ